MVALISSIFSLSLSWGVTMLGNLPALLRPGPSRRGICLIKLSEARKALYFFASFLSLFIFLRSSADIAGIPNSLAWSRWTWSPSTHTFILGLGMCFNFTVPLKRLSLGDRSSSDQFGTQWSP